MEFCRVSGLRSADFELGLELNSFELVEFAFKVDLRYVYPY